MTRVLSVLFVVLLFVGVAFFPKADPHRLAVQAAPDLLSSSAYLTPDEVQAAADAAEAGAPPPEPAKKTRTPIDVLLESSAFEATEWAPVLDAEGKVVVDAEGNEQRKVVAGKLSIYGVRYDTLGLGSEIDEAVITADEETSAFLIHGELKDALVRGLRTWAGKQGIELELLGAERGMYPQGANFLLVSSPGRLELGIDIVRGQLSERFVFDWNPPKSSSIWPPIVAIALALALRKPVIALFAGVWMAAMLVRMEEGGGALVVAFGGLWDVFSRYFWNELLDNTQDGREEQGRMMVVGFVVAMLAMVGIVTRNGGLRGVMDHVARLAQSARRTQIATWFMGLLVFFDDYANTILVGSTMRPLSDRFRIAREKLAYIVDSTAAPVAGISIFSTWIAFEVSTFSAQLPAAGLTPDRGYEVFIQTLPFRFYCILTLFFVGLIVVSGRDFGPMLTAERRARREGKVVRDGATPMVGERATAMEAAPGIVPKAYRAVVPLSAFLLVTIGWMLWSGWTAEGIPESFDEFGVARGLTMLLGASSSYDALFYGSCTGLVLAIVFSLLAGMRGEIARAAWNTLASMGIAIVILYLAWMIGEASKSLGTATYLTVALRDQLQPALLPVILFMLAGAVSFATGSSWGTMSILLPLVVGLSFSMGGMLEIGGMALMILSIGAVLEGSIFGDHCSPLSDTTVLSSVATASDHMDHVRTQIPYALLTMVVAIAVCYLPCTVLGWSPFLALGLGAGVLVVALWVLGERVEPRGAEPMQTLDTEPAVTSSVGRP